MRHSRGFTLLELLVVIAMIGILATVVLVSLEGVRAKGRLTAALQTMRGLQGAWGICMSSNTDINLPSGDTNNGGGGLVCAGSDASYLLLPDGWIYCDGTPAPGAQAPTNCGDDASDQNRGIDFSIVAESNGDGMKITCAEEGCTYEPDTD